MRRLALGAVALGGLGLVGLGGWQALALRQVPVESVTPDESVTAPPPAAPVEEESSVGNASAAAAEAPKSTAPIVPDKPLATALTPLAERVATLGLLNKRNGVSRDLTLRPGQAIKVGDVIVRLKSCETTAPWEDQKLTGAFVQLDVKNRDATYRRAFSGWLFKESPSLNVVEDPVYDVWPKSCTMVHPDIRPDTLRVSGSTVSSAKKSAETPKAPNEPVPSPPVPTPSAESSNPT
jgi:hypothetical protein